jgi:hypothetical protein
VDNVELDGGGGEVVGVAAACNCSVGALGHCGVRARNPAAWSHSHGGFRVRRERGSGVFMEGGWLGEGARV